MEKYTPHCKLSVVRALIREGKIRATRAAVIGASRMNLDVIDIVRIVRELNSGDFFKSMTTYGDHTIWQDVYRPRTAMGIIYLKLTVIEDVLVVSFKEADR